MPDDDLRFGDVETGGGSGGGLASMIELVMQLTIMAIMLFVFYKVVMTLLPML